MFKKFVSSVLGSRQTKGIEEQLETVLLERAPFLKGADKTLIAELAAALESIDYQKGVTIFNEGDPGDCLFLIVNGAVRVSSKGELIAELGVGGCFGEGALLKDGIRGATVVASEDLTLFRLKSESFKELSEKYIKVRYRLRSLDEERRAENIENLIERNLLSHAPFLNGAGGDLISELSQHLEHRICEKGEVLIQEGDEGTSFFLIEEGILGVSKAGSQITELGPGACLGEGALFSRMKCSATVTALAQTSCFVLGVPAFNSIIKRYPVFGRRLQKISEERKTRS